MDNILGLTAALAALAAWLTHLIVTVQADALTAAMVGVFFPPYGIISGALLWFGIGIF